MSDSPAVGGTQPIQLEAAAGETYWWCTCGRSKKQPFCDGSHQGTSFTPMQWSPETTRRVFFCTCKKTAKSPLCDGSHTKL